MSVQIAKNCFFITICFGCVCIVIYISYSKNKLLMNYKGYWYTFMFQKFSHCIYLFLYKQSIICICYCCGYKNTNKVSLKLNYVTVVSLI